MPQTKDYTVGHKESTAIEARAGVPSYFTSRAYPNMLIRVDEDIGNQTILYFENLSGRRHTCLASDSPQNMPEESSNVRSETPEYATINWLQNHNDFNGC